MPEPLRSRWLTAIPLTYRDNIGFWDRDCGLLTLALLKIGVDSKFVALGKPGVRKDVPLILGQLDQWREPDWWKQWQADGVVFNSWGVRRYEAAARAIKASGARLVIRLDTDGFQSPRVHFWRFLKNHYIFARDFKPGAAGLYALAKTLWHRLVPRAYDRPFVRHLEHADAIILESPLAHAMVGRYLRGLGRSDLAAKLRVVAHPISDEFCYEPGIAKQPRVLAVGRYNVYVKDAPLLTRVLERVLPHNPDYTTTIIGPGMEKVQRWHGKLPEPLQRRVTVTGRVEPSALKRYYQEAQIIVFTSRSEGFPIAGEEAMSCGCTVVGPGTLPAFHYMTSESSGTCSISRETVSMCDALAAEMEFWRRGFRDPKKISDLWRPRVAASAVAAQIINLCSR